MSKRVGIGIAAALAGLAATAVVVVPGIASGSAGSKANLTAQASTRTQLAATLTGTAEFPGPGNSNGSGNATITIDSATNEICWAVTVSGIGPTILAHIHQGAVGVAGPVVVNLFPPLPNPTSTGCVVDAVHAPQILANTTGFYVNVHTNDFPAGAVRGQLGAGLASAGDAHFLPVPLRAYDSRVDPAGKLNAGQTRTISLATGLDASMFTQLAVPPGATAAIVTLTVTQTVGAGFVKLYSAALGAEPPTSSINWSADEQILSVSTPVAVDPTAQVKITGGVNATNVVIDVVGYYV